MQDIVFITGNRNRAGASGFGQKRRAFEKKVISALGGERKVRMVSSKSFSEVPDAGKYFGWSRGCSRMKHGRAGASKVCLDDYQKAGASAKDAGHYSMTAKMYDAIRK